MAQLEPKHPDLVVWKVLLRNAFGTVEAPFADLLLNQLLNLARRDDGTPAEAVVDGLLAAVTGVGPRDEVEAMLAAQMAAVHVALMDCFQRAIHAEHLGPRESHLRHAGALARTFALQLDALNRHRGKGGRQTVTVEHVHVHQGGQAVVGAVAAGGGTNRGEG